ncbi:MAG: hypothetical protein KAZ70_00915, partial [Actinomyces sp.]|nr:hypothetical protein [Actinomyces sp.]
MYIQHLEMYMSMLFEGKAMSITMLTEGAAAGTDLGRRLAYDEVPHSLVLYAATPAHNEDEGQRRPGEEHG